VLEVLLNDLEAHAKANPGAQSLRRRRRVPLGFVSQRPAGEVTAADEFKRNLRSN
jgi:hypothetical protein